MNTLKFLSTCALFLGLCSGVTAQVTVPSSDGVSVSISDARRIITMGGSITETVYALGAGAQVIATDQSSTYPAEVFQLPKVPYLRALTSEGILSLSPSLIISSADVRPLTAVQQIRVTGTNMLLVEEVETLAGVIQKIETIGLALGKEKEAQQLITQNKLLYQRADSLQQNLTQKPKVMFVLAIRGESTFMVAGNNSGAQSMIELAGGENAFYNFEGYKTITNEAVLAANPDIIITMTSRYAEVEAGLKKTPAINLTKAVKNNQIVGIEGNFLLGFGPRFGEAILYLMEILHPEMKPKM